MNTKRPARVLVLWADPAAANLGLRALASGAADAAYAAYGDAEITFHSHNTPNTPLKLKLAIRDALRKNGVVTKYLDDFDVILDTGGGDSFTDIYGIRRLFLMSLIMRAARKSRCTTVMTPQTIGPFDTTTGRIMARRVLANVDVVATRDPLSTACAVELGRSPNVEATDLVFEIEKPQAVELGKGILVNVSGLLWRPNPHVDYERYRSDVTSLIEALLVQNYDVTLLAHVLDSGVPDTDVHVVSELGGKYRGRVGTLVPTSLDQVRSAMADSGVVIGSRMHACLNALSVGTPAVAWSYSRKFDPLMAALRWTHTIDLRESTGIVDETVKVCKDALDGVLARDVETCNKNARLALTRFEQELRKVESQVPGSRAHK